VLLPLALSKDQIHAFIVRIRDDEEWHQRAYKQKVERTGLCCCLHDGSHRDAGACGESLDSLPVAFSWRGRECLMEQEPE